MANLLPQEYKNGLQSEYTLRLTAGGLGLFAIALAVGTALLVPSFLLIDNKRDRLRQQLEAVTQAAGTSSEQLRSTIQATEEKLARIESTTQQTLKPTQILSIVTKNQPDGIKIQRISVSQAKDESINVRLSGTAATRSQLLSFEDNLSRQAEITQVKLPINTLARRENADFTLTLTIKPL